MRKVNFRRSQKKYNGLLIGPSLNTTCQDFLDGVLAARLPFPQESVNHFYQPSKKSGGKQESSVALNVRCQTVKP